MEGTSKAVLGSSDQWKVVASLSLVLKSEKIPDLLYVGKGVIFDLFPWPTGLGHKSQITEGLYSGPSPIPKPLESFCTACWFFFT